MAEGSVDSKCRQITVEKLHECELPFEIGSLERSAFSVLDDWEIRCSDGFAFAYRIGVKEGIIDNEGKRVVLVVYFAVPLTRKGEETNPGLIQQNSEKVSTLLHALMAKSLLSIPEYAHNVVAISSQPPDYMLSELQACLSQQK
jgi:hypothetical protein